MVVTGASGNAGSAVLSVLDRAGHHVSGLSRRVPDRGPTGLPAAQWWSVDLTDDDPAPLREAVRGADVRPRGAFNLASDEPMTVDLLAEALGTRPVHVPAAVLRATVAGLWHARLEQLDPGWIDLAYAVPLLHTGRALRELGWRPRHSGRQVVAELVDGMRTAASGSSPVLRPRSVVDSLRTALADGPVHRRLRP